MLKNKHTQNYKSIKHRNEETLLENKLNNSECSGEKMKQAVDSEEIKPIVTLF